MNYTKICKCCGKEFQTNNPQKIYCDDQHHRPCPVCGKPVAMIDNDFSRPAKCCSSECAHKKSQLSMKLKICEFCGQEFSPRSGCQTICDRKHFQTCEICGKKFEISKKNIQQHKFTCSKECSKEKRRRSNQLKYGVDHPMQNKDVQQIQRNSMKSKYGVEFALQDQHFKDKASSSIRDKFGVDWALCSSEVRKKSTQTMIEKYGAATTLQSEELKEKVRHTLQEKYGIDNPTKSKEIRMKMYSTNLTKYGCENPMQNSDVYLSAIKTRIENYGEFWPKEIDDHAKSTFLSRYGVDNFDKSSELMEKARQTCLQKYGVPYGCLTDSAQKHVNKISKRNIDFHDRLKSVGVDSEYEFYLSGKFYDLFIPSQNTLVEIDPTYTHNIIGNHWNEDGLNAGYHLSKTEIARNNGYRCIHIFDWDDIDKIVNMLRPIENVIYARKCTLFKLNLNVAIEFLKQYHLQGSCRGQLLCLGLVYEGDLIQVMTFGKSRYDKKHDIELLRLCTKPGYRVVGGASRLFNFATEKLEIYNIISYCDKSKFTGDVYSKIGMSHLRTTAPQEVWSREGDKITANLLRQRGYDQLFHTNYGKGTSNEQLMIENGWLPIFDCGQEVYEFK